MNSLSQPIAPKHRFPAAIVDMATYIYRNSPLSYRDVADQLRDECNIDLSHKTIYEWNGKMPKNTRLSKDQSIVDTFESLVTLNGKKFLMYTATNTFGEVLGVVVRKRRNLNRANQALRLQIYGY